MGDRGYYRDSYDRNDRRGYPSGGTHRSRQSGGSGRLSSEHYTPTWSWASTIVSVISMTLFASWFGIMGVLFSGLSYTDHKVGDYKRSRYKRWWSWCCAVSGIVLTVVLIVMLVMVMLWIDVAVPTFPNYRYWIPPWLLERLNSTAT